MKNSIKKGSDLICRYCSDTSGATAMEYALMVALLSVALISSYKLIADGSNSLWNHISNEYNSA